MGWQDIGVRPRTGYFLVGGTVEGEWWVAAASHNYGETIDDLCAYSAYSEPLSFTPTHWQPLPEPPEPPAVTPDNPGVQS